MRHSHTQREALDGSRYVVEHKRVQGPVVPTTDFPIASNNPQDPRPLLLSRRRLWVLDLPR